MSNSVALRPEVAMPRNHASEFGLYASDGARKYLNRHERQRVLAEFAKLPTERALFCLTLAWTGARISEVLALTTGSIQIEQGIVAIHTLKRRRNHVRELPIPPDLIGALTSISTFRGNSGSRMVLLHAYGHGLGPPRSAL